MEALWAIPVAQLAAGDVHSAALTINGFLFTWGNNEKGQLGLATGADAVAQVCSYQVCRDQKWKLGHQNTLKLTLQLLSSLYLMSVSQQLVGIAKVDGLRPSSPFMNIGGRI